MVFEFTVTPEFDFLARFADFLGTEVSGNRLAIPPRLGNGYVTSIDLGPEFRFVTHQYTLVDELTLRRLPSEPSDRLVSIFFNGREEPGNDPFVLSERCRKLLTNSPAIQIAASALATETVCKTGREVHFAVFHARADALARMLGVERPVGLMETVLAGKEPFFFHECMLPEMRRVMGQIFEAEGPPGLTDFFLRIKVQELLYLLFSKLECRDCGRRHNPVSRDDIRRLYEVQAAIVGDLSRPPRLADLARESGMSETKLKKLFRQTFGDSIYNYYQRARMEEAAELLADATNSVSEVGYRLGFENLSHFGRLFRKHFGVTPKKFAQRAGWDYLKV